jgi:hypothetical protein
MEKFLSKRNDSDIVQVVQITVFVICQFVRFSTFKVLLAVTTAITLYLKCLSQSIAHLKVYCVMPLDFLFGLLTKN